LSRSVIDDSFLFVRLKPDTTGDDDIVHAIDTEEAESTERISHRDTKTQRISVSRCLRG